MLWCLIVGSLFDMTFSFKLWLRNGRNSLQLIMLSSQTLRLGLHSRSNLYELFFPIMCRMKMCTPFSSQSFPLTMQATQDPNHLMLLWNFLKGRHLNLQPVEVDQKHHMGRAIVQTKTQRRWQIIVTVGESHGSSHQRRPPGTCSTSRKRITFPVLLGELEPVLVTLSGHLMMLFRF